MNCCAEQVADLKGPQGVQGQQGLRGQQGQQGIEGLQGIGGKQGEQGIQGPLGPSGPIGGVGPQGNIGPQGDIGPQGVVGFPGLRGDTGNQAAKGDQGAKGLKGAKGVKGATGGPGPQGPQGIPGIDAALPNFGYLRFTSRKPQTSPVLNVYLILDSGISNSTDFSNGISVTSSTDIKFVNAGIYQVHLQIPVASSKNSVINFNLDLGVSIVLTTPIKMSPSYINFDGLIEASSGGTLNFSINGGIELQPTLGSSDAYLVVDIIQIA